MKTLFLIQSCNQDRYLYEETILRETYLRRVRKSDDYYFYRGGNDKHEISDNVIRLNCNDDLENTFRKTIMAFSIFRNNEFDFIVRMNTSNWINMEMLYATLESIDPESPELVGTSFLTNGKSYGIPFLRGNMIIFTKRSLNDLMESIKTNAYGGVDDVAIGLNLCKYWTNTGVDYFKSIKLIKNKKYDEKTIVKDIKENVLIRCAEKIKETENSDIIKEIDKKYIQNFNAKPEVPKIMSTILGELKLY